LIEIVPGFTAAKFRVMPGFSGSWAMVALLTRAARWPHAQRRHHVDRFFDVGVRGLTRLHLGGSKGSLTQVARMSFLLAPAPALKIRHAAPPRVLVNHPQTSSIDLVTFFARS
jgi:hypothetical protein